MRKITPNENKAYLFEALFNQQPVHSNGINVLCLEQIQKIAKTSGFTVRDVETACLENGLVPYRYLRNIGTLGIDGQIKLLQSSVAVVGLGGLGGYVAEVLARAGVGKLILIDGDKFQDNNLNRQLLCNECNIGLEKALEAQKRISHINSSVETSVYTINVDDMNFARLINEANVLVDAIDSIDGRRNLQKYAQCLEIPMVHGSIAGFLGQVMTIFPSDNGLSSIYGDTRYCEKTGIESNLGNLSPTPMAVAAWQAQEVIKIISEKGQPLRNKILLMNMEYNTIEIISLL